MVACYVFYYCFGFYCVDDSKEESSSSLPKVDDVYEDFSEETESMLSPNGSVDKQGDDVDIMAGIDDLDGQHFEVLDVAEDGIPSATETTPTGTTEGELHVVHVFKEDLHVCVSFLIFLEIRVHVDALVMRQLKIDLK